MVYRLMIIQWALKTRSQLVQATGVSISILTSCLLFSQRPQGLCSTTSSSSSSLSSPECSFRTSMTPSVKLFAISLLFFHLHESCTPRNGQLQRVLTSKWMRRLSSSWLLTGKKRRLRAKIKKLVRMSR